MKMRVICTGTNFYPRSPCGERPCGRRVGLPVAGHFYPRSPCGERLIRQPATSRNNKISIHALLAESDKIERGV